MQKKAISNLLFLLVLCFLFSCILILNINTPLIGDDFVYSFIYQTQDRLTSIDSIFYSQYLHYYQWGGRSVVHFIAQALLLINNPLAIDMINSAAFIVFVLLIHYHIVGKLENSLSIFIISFSLIWFLQPVFAETVLWITGSSNYLWGTLIILLFLLPYRLYSGAKPPLLIGVMLSLYMLIGGIVAGWTNENTAAAMIAMILCFMVYYRCKKYPLPLWMYAGLLGAIIGYIMMIAAPGNFVRAEGSSISPFLISYRVLTYTQRFVNYLGLLNLAIALLLIVYSRITLTNKRTTLVYMAIYFIGLFVSIYIMVASPGFPARAWFGTITLNIIAFGIVYNRIKSSLPIIKQAKYCFLAFCMVSFAASYYDAYKDVTGINRIWKERLAIIEEKKNANEQSVVFKEYQARTKFGLGDTPYALPYISLYYGIDFELEK